MGNLRPHQLLKGESQLQLCFGKQGGSVLALCWALSYVGPTDEQKSWLSYFEIQFLVFQSQLSFDCWNTLGGSLRHVMHVNKRGGEVGHLALLLLRCGDTVGDIEGTKDDGGQWEKSVYSVLSTSR